LTVIAFWNSRADGACAAGRCNLEQYHGAHSRI
jgi:hypothetical protein